MQEGELPVTWEQVAEKLSRIGDTIQQIGQAVRKLSEADPDEAGRVRDSAKRSREALNGIVMETTKAVANAHFKSFAESRSDEGDYEQKKQWAISVNETLRQQGAVIEHPDTKEPSLLLAVGSPDGKGRYVLSSRESKRRTKTSMTLMDMLPITPMPDLPRREPFLERRKSGEGKQAGHESQNWTQHVGGDAEGRGRRP